MIRVGIIGCGKIAEFRHAPEYKENSDAEIVAFFDVNKKEAQRMADEYGARACDTLDELLSLDIDAVSVCVANKYHAEISIKALEAGKHVLCEKPMAVSAEECIAMLEAEKKSGKMLMIGHNQRMTQAHQKARELYLDGEIGRLLTFHMTFGHPGPEKWTGSNNSWFFDKNIASFGSMADLGVHKTDLMQFLTGEKITETFTLLATLDKRYPDGTPIQVDDNAIAIYKLSNGAIGTLHVSWTFYGAEVNSTILYGTEGRMRIYDDPEYALIVEKPGHEPVMYVLDKMISNEEQSAGNRTNTGVIDAFIKSIREGRKYLASGEEGASAMSVIFANERSSMSKRLETVCL